ncbi:MAG: peroxide stress protein YaaA [Gammaproteobacteria bacterium]|nr:peroxide stress protein YaaA [Gammaproteobacteria bacterium]
MLILISPAKTLDFETVPKTKKASKPIFGTTANKLVKIMRQQSASDLSKLMGISKNLAELNAERFNSFVTKDTNTKIARQAIFAFKGDVYQGINVQNYNERDFSFAQKHIRILSGLYGVLKPLDLIQPYRLEMGTKLKTERGESLYEFWNNQISRAIQKELLSHKNQTIINLASNEYFKAVSDKSFGAKIINPIFKDHNKGSFKIISFYAKKARGCMASFIVRNRISTPSQIKKFSEDGYRYNESLSSETDWIFTRKNS